MIVFNKRGYSVISPVTEWHSFAALDCSKRYRVDGGWEEYPITSAPKEVKKSVSQVPLNPVCPVINTFFYAKKM